VATTDLGVWEPFDVASVLTLMAGSEVTWWLSGGEALDVFAERPTRAHADIDISLRRSDVPAFHRFVADTLLLKIAHDGQLHEAPDLPIGHDVNGVWARETPTGPWRLQVNLEPIEAGEWSYRREPRVRLPLEQVIRRRDDGLPYVAPAVQLLWKAKDTRPKDIQDFELIAPLLDAHERRWLAGAISLCHPESAWTDRLAECKLPPPPVSDSCSPSCGST
jgi:hypothetical protein